MLEKRPESASGFTAPLISVMPYISTAKPTQTVPMSLRRALGHQDHKDANGRDDGGEVLRLDKTYPYAVGVYPGETRIQAVMVVPEIGAHDHADGLTQLHDPGVDKTHQHDRHSGGGLDSGSDPGTQQHALERTAG